MDEWVGGWVRVGGAGVDTRQPTVLRAWTHIDDACTWDKKCKHSNLANFRRATRT